MHKRKVEFVSIKPYVKDLSSPRNRENGRMYELGAKIDGVLSSYIVVVNQAIGGIENGRPLWDLQYENTGGLYPKISDIEKKVGYLVNGEARDIYDEWRRQYYTDPELLGSAKESRDEWFLERVENEMEKYGLAST